MDVGDFDFGYECFGVAKFIFFARWFFVVAIDFATKAKGVTTFEFHFLVATCVGYEHVVAEWFIICPLDIDEEHLATLSVEKFGGEDVLFADVV